MFPLFLSLLPLLIPSAYLYPMENKALSTRQQQQHWGLRSPHTTTQIKLKDTKHQDHTAITSRLLHLAYPKTKTTTQQSTIVYDMDGDKQTNRQSPSTSRLAVVIGKSLVDCGFERMRSFHLVCGGAREACGWLDQKESLHGLMERTVICLVGVVVLGGGMQTMERLVAAGFGGNRRFTMVRWGKGDMLVILGEGLNVHG